MNHKLFLIADLEEVEYTPAGTPVTLGGMPHTVVDHVRGDDGRWSRTNLVIVRDGDTRHWAIPWEQGLADDYDGERGFRPHATDAANPEYISAHEVSPTPVQSIIWEAVK